jgi:hypothetical protein
MLLQSPLQLKLPQLPSLPLLPQQPPLRQSLMQLLSKHLVAHWTAEMAEPQLLGVLDAGQAI